MERRQGGNRKAEKRFKVFFQEKDVMVYGLIGGKHAFVDLLEFRHLLV
jgi:hypothetical protein